MPFRIALSGLNASSSDLNVTANNIANANTTGFKGSRAEFGERYLDVVTDATIRLLDDVERTFEAMPPR